MATKDPIKAIEDLNSEYLAFKKNPETFIPGYTLARKAHTLKKNFPHILKWWKKRRDYFKVKDKSDSISRYIPKSEVTYYTSDPITDKKGVVYSCITRGYDCPIDPLLVSNSLDYKLFTDEDSPVENEGVWKKNRIEICDYKGHKNYINRFYKFHPHQFFEKGDYDYSIYIDGNVQIMSDVTSLYRVAHNSKTGIAMHRHFARDCAYLDALWCEYNNRGNIEAIKEQMCKYKKEMFPEHFGLCEATIIVVDLHNRKSKEIMEAWWDEFVRSNVGRDQMIFPYILWKYGLSINDVGSLGNDEYQNPKFRIYEHVGELF